jgi:hypothetical protein
MNSPKRSLTALAVLGLFFVTSTGLAGPPPKKDKGEKQQEKQEQKAEREERKAVKKQEHKNGKNLLGEKIKKNGRHVLDKKGNYESEVDVKDGKVAGFHVKHAQKGAVPVTKYKTKKKMAMRSSSSNGVVFASMQQEYIDTVWIGFAYVDEYGYEEIYWFPYDMVYDGDTGAIEYYPV